MGKEGAIVLGEVVHQYDESVDPFRYDPTRWELTMNGRTIQLDEMGIEAQS